MTSHSHLKTTIILPAKNEEAGLAVTLPHLIDAYSSAEIIVVNDGSTDNTVSLCQKLKVKCVTHPYSMGNGAAIKTGARCAKGDVLVFLDADGQHDAADVSRLLEKLDGTYDMVVGARIKGSQASVGRSIANLFYNRLASWVTGHRIPDLTSGFRAARTANFREFLHLLPNGFSYPTTITMAFFRSGYPVAYVPIKAAKRQGKSHIKPLQDGIRFLLIIFKIGTLYSPLKIFIPISTTFFLTGVCYYLYTYITQGRFTNMSALVITTAVVIFLIGLVSEQITHLMYIKNSKND